MLPAFDPAVAESSMRRLAALLACIALCRGGLAVADSPVEEVLETDRAFAAMATERSTPAAFLEYLAADAVLFRPLAVNGREWFETHVAASGRLQWSPAGGAVSCDGTLAVTAGPWTYVEPEGRQQDSGYYLSVWRREGAGGWRVALDHGIDGAEPDGGSALLAASLAELGTGTGSRRCRGDAKGLARAEQKLNAALQARSAADAFARSGVDSALVLRDGAAPLPARQVTAPAWLAPGAVTYESLASVAATDGDLGFSHGELRARGGPDGAAPTAIYVRVWQRERRDWRLALDLTTQVDTVPEPTPESAP